MKYPTTADKVIPILERELGEKMDPTSRELWTEILVPIANEAHQQGTILGHTFISEYCKVYRKSKTYDRYLHLFGSFTFSLFTYSIISSLMKPVPSKGYVAVLIAMLGISVGDFFEIAQFTLDTVLKKAKYQKSQHAWQTPVMT